MAKNICFVGQSRFPNDIRVRKEAMALRSKGYGVTVISIGSSFNDPKTENIDGVKVYRKFLPKKRSGIIRYIIEYIAFFMYSFYKINVLDIKEKFDIIHISTLPDFLIFCSVIQKLKGKKILLDLHEIMPEFFMSKYKVSIKNLFVRILLFIEKISLNFADDIITVNDPIKKIFLKRAVPNRKISVVMNTVDRAMVYQKEKKKHRGFRCIYHGTLTDIYGLATAIKAFSKAYRKFSGMIFHIVGVGPELVKLQSLAKQLNLQKVVIFHGKMPYDKVINFIRYMDVAILASRKDIFMDLTFSNKLSEYIYLKIPVISSNLETTKYYFNDKKILYFESGNVDDLAQKIQFAFENRERIRTMADSAFDTYKAYEWDIMADRYLKVIEGF